MGKIVMLNSGGFDSVVLANHVHAQHYLGDEVHSMFLDWGQKCVKSERKKSHAWADILGFEKVDLKIPSFSWGDSLLTNGKSESQYVPLRNLVFLSYALSYAKGVGAKIVYVAFVRNPNEEYYEDTSPDFLEAINKMSSQFGIEVKAPFIHCLKDTVLKAYARFYNIGRDDFHSCNLSDKPCGTCPDCTVLEEIYEDIDSHIVDDMLIDNGFQFTEHVIDAIKDSPITGMQVYVNNECQFKCKHCFLGDVELKAAPLEEDEWYFVFRQAAKMGIRSVDFFGKEPLYDDRVFSLIDACRKFGIATSIITNGVNVPKYIEQLKEYKPLVTVSVEKLSDTEYRDGGSHIANVLKMLVENEIPTGVSIDLSKSNVWDLKQVVDNIINLGVHDFYIKPLRPMGKSEDSLMDELLTDTEILCAVESLVKYTEKVVAYVTFAFSMMDLQRLHGNNLLWHKYLGFCIQSHATTVDGINFELELFCHRFKDKIAITPDGYVLGCAGEFCVKDKSAFNVRSMTLLEIVQREKKMLCAGDYLKVGCWYCAKYTDDVENFLK